MPMWVPMSIIDWTIAFGFCGVAAIATWLWHRHPNLAAVSMVVGVTALGIFVSAVRVPDLQNNNPADPLDVTRTESYALSVTLATQPTISYPSSGPMAGVATGGAAPPATTNPYAVRPTSLASPMRGSSPVGGSAMRPLRNP
jgi:hypothetical protein